jgi:DNA gyrase/topoisomerase IV subunit B
LQVTVNRDGKTFEQEYERGAPKYAVREIGSSTTTGTKVHFWPDTTIFTASVYNKDILEGRLRELSYLNKRIRITLNDLRELDEAGNHYQQVFFSEGGIIPTISWVKSNAAIMVEHEIPLQWKTTIGHVASLNIMSALRKLCPPFDLPSPPKFNPFPIATECHRTYFSLNAVVFSLVFSYLVVFSLVLFLPKML